MSFKRHIIILFLALLSLVPLAARADQAQILSEGKLAISPFLFDGNITPDQTLTRQITIYNLSDVPLPLKVSINDFEPVGDHGGVRFLNPNEQANPETSLVSWLAISGQPDFTIPAHGSTALTFTITPKENAEPGTRFAGFLFSYTDNEQAGAINTKVTRKIGALVLVRTGQAQERGSIEKFITTEKLYTKPVVEFLSRFNNAGNVHVSPKGKIEIRNIFGQLTAVSYINENAQYVLPNSTRQFQSIFSNKFLFGPYTASATMYYGYGSQKLEAHAATTFWVIPYKQIVIVILIIIFLAILLRLYNHWIIRRSKQ